MTRSEIAASMAASVYPLPQEISLTGEHAPLANAAIVIPPGDRDARFAADLLSRWVAEDY